MKRILLTILLAVVFIPKIMAQGADTTAAYYEKLTNHLSTNLARLLYLKEKEF